jgi:hypothetical protein
VNEVASLDERTNARFARWPSASQDEQPNTRFARQYSLRPTAINSLRSRILHSIPPTIPTNSPSPLFPFQFLGHQFLFFDEEVDFDPRRQVLTLRTWNRTFHDTFSAYEESEYRPHPERPGEWTQFKQVRFFFPASWLTLRERERIDERGWERRC